MVLHLILIHLLCIFLTTIVIIICTLLVLYIMMFNSSLSSFLKVRLLCWYHFLCLLILFYIARAFSLGIWFGANIMTGRIILISIVFYPFSGLVLSCPIGLLIVFALFLMELGVAILQAYVFMLLTTSYLHDGLYLH